MFSIIEDETLRGNLEVLCVYVSYRFVNTYPMICDDLSTEMLIKYFDTYLNERIDSIMLFLKLINSSVTISQGDA